MYDLISSSGGSCGTGGGGRIDTRRRGGGGGGGGGKVARGGGGGGGRVGRGGGAVGNWAGRYKLFTGGKYARLSSNCTGFTVGCGSGANGAAGTKLNYRNIERTMSL